MKNPFFRKNLTNSLILLFAILVLGVSGCQVIKWGVDQFGDVITNLGNDTNQILDEAINDLNGNAENYGNIMQEAIDNISEQSIKNQLENALDNANKIIVTASTEIKCNIQFTADYLVKRIKAIKAQFNDNPPPKEEPQVCTIIPSIIDMNRPANQRNAVMITGYFLDENFSKYKLYHYTTSGSRSNKTSSLGRGTDFKIVINLGSSGITLNDNSGKLVLIWDDQIVSEIQVIQRQPEPCRIRERTFTGLPKLVIYPQHKKSPWVNNKGDKEFDGNGPCTTGSVSIFTRNNGRELWASAFVRMWECPDNLGRIKKDYTYGDKRREIKLAETDSGWRIKTIKDSRNDSFQNIDRNADRTEGFSGSGPVSRYLISGDTSGDDLGSSRVEITFKEIKVTLEELGDCIRN